MLRIKPFQAMESIEQGEAVLAAGDPDRNMVSLLDHRIFINRFSCNA